MLGWRRNGWALGGLFVGTVSSIGMAATVTANAEGSPMDEAARKKQRKERRDKSEAQLKKYSRGIVLDNLDRGDHTQVEDYRHVVAVVGITGSGKSSTANTMMFRNKQKKTFYEAIASNRSGYSASQSGASHWTNNAIAATGASDAALRRANEFAKPERNRKFGVSDSLTSMTHSISFRDYTFRGVPYRIIDTPGLFDTNRPPEEIQEELQAFAKYAPHGVSTFMVVVPMGRATAEHEAALIHMSKIFGPTFTRHAVVAITHALTPKPSQSLLTRDKLLDEVGNLSPSHFLRELVEAAELRVVGVENKLEPMRTTSQIMLNQAVLNTVDDNDGDRYDCQHLVDGASWIDSSTSSATTKGLSPTAGAPEKHTQPCTQHVTRRPDGKSVFELVCEPGSGIPAALASAVRAMLEKP